MKIELSIRDVSMGGLLKMEIQSGVNDSVTIETDGKYAACIGLEDIEQVIAALHAVGLSRRRK